MRSLGYQKPPALNKQLLFQAGLTSEDSWLETLTAAWDGVILTEDEVPTKWHTTNGTPVTGRPDLVLCERHLVPATIANPDPTGLVEVTAPVLGLELKLVCSPFTAYNVLAKQQPDLSHLIQAAHYMWQLDEPFKLVYTSRSNYSLGFGSMKKKWDSVPETYFNGSGTSVEPFVVEYDLWFEDGTLVYQIGEPHNSEPQTTDVTVKGIEKYYECTANIAETGSLGPRPEGKNVFNQKMSWHPCDGCPLAEACDDYEHDYELWIDHAKKELE
jgi:hypothetical protein